MRRRRRGFYKGIVQASCTNKTRHSDNQQPKRWDTADLFVGLTREYDASQKIIGPLVVRKKAHKPQYRTLEYI
ncbi:hypothetical protein T11_4175 [Trichinella zimbabwensis]|uniref:Uncharacterized protein n=1 Tax=Trichinella zimbabwensis TaxID=268475 RepID=A0A0V1GNQ8_9BILA|nr:hypothetical protein T11_16972 [Trichinella zimbabwensis]KRZ00366.1 hypothetical protein T11_4175 [Trichinella zimbabwensis]